MIHRVVGAGQAPLAVLQLAHEGHRLAYVRALLDSAETPGPVLVLLTEQGLASREAQVHLGRAAATGAARLHSVGSANEPTTTLVRRALDMVDGSWSLAVPDADRMLAALAARSGRGDRPRLCLLLMRTAGIPRARPGIRELLTAGRATGVQSAKKALLLLLRRRWPEVRVGFLTDSWSIVTERPGFAGVVPVPDPRPRLPEVSRRRSRAAFGIDGGAFVLGLLGDVTARKHPLLTLDAVPSLPPEVLVLVAGRTDAAADRRLAELAADPTTAHRVLRRPGYLTDEELAGCLAACDALVLSYDTDAPSGMLALAQGYGVPVIAAGSPWVRTLVERLDAGIVTDLSTAGVVRAAGRLRTQPPVRAAPDPGRYRAAGPREFTRALLGD